MAVLLVYLVLFVSSAVAKLPFPERGLKVLDVVGSRPIDGRGLETRVYPQGFGKADVVGPILYRNRVAMLLLGPPLPQKFTIPGPKPLPFFRPGPITQADTGPKPFYKPRLNYHRTSIPESFLPPEPTPNVHFRPRPISGPGFNQHNNGGPRPFFGPGLNQHNNGGPRPFFGPGHNQQITGGPRPFFGPVPNQHNNGGPTPFFGPGLNQHNNGGPTPFFGPGHNQHNNGGPTPFFGPGHNQHNNGGPTPFFGPGHNQQINLGLKPFGGPGLKPFVKSGPQPFWGTEQTEQQRPFLGNFQPGHYLSPGSTQQSRLESESFAQSEPNSEPEPLDKFMKERKACKHGMRHKNIKAEMYELKPFAKIDPPKKYMAEPLFFLKMILNRMKQTLRG